MANKKQTSEKITRTAAIIGIVGSILASFLIWIYAIGYDSTLFESTFDGVEVTLEGEAALAETRGFTLAESQKFSSITVVAKGKRSELNALTAADFRAVIDVSQVSGAGEQTLAIVVYSPNGIEVVSQSSTSAAVFVDKFTQKNELLTVSVDTGKNYVMTEGITSVTAVANPLSVIVSGPQSVLEKIDGAFVRFNLDGHVIDRDIYGYGAIELRDKDGNVIENPYLTVSDTAAYVSITVTQQKTLPVRVMFTGGLFEPSAVGIGLSSSTVTVSGSPSVLSDLDEIVLSIDESTVDGTKEFSFAVGSLLPEGVTNESGFPRITARVTLPKLATKTFVVPDVNIEVNNLPYGAVYKRQNTVTVTVIGSREELASLDSSMIKAVADFDRVTVGADGSYYAPLTLTVDKPLGGAYILNEGTLLHFTLE